MPQSSPGFTFAAGNAKKLLALPLYALGGLATLVVPRKRGHWVFGCGSGIGEGALELYRAASAQRSLVWLARNDRDLADAKALGMRAVRKSSWRGFVATLRAEVIVVTHGLGDANRFGTRGGFVVQLWHGIPYKRINLDTKQTMSSRFLPGSRLVRRLLTRLHRTASSTISFVPAASEISATRLRSAFGLPSGKVVVTGDPRDDVLVRGSEAERTATARELLFSRLSRPDGGERVVLYAPTWRDGGVDPGVPSPQEWRRIAAWLDANDSLLVLRPHPLGVGDYAAGPDVSGRIAVLSAALQGDINPLLPAVDLLLTDYSSIAYDFALTGRPIAYLAPDLESYAATRGVYEPYELFSGGSHVSSWRELLDLLERAETDPLVLERLAAHSVRLALHHHSFRDGRNTARVYAEIIQERPVTVTQATTPGESDAAGGGAIAGAPTAGAAIAGAAATAPDPTEGAAATDPASPAVVSARLEHGGVASLILKGPNSLGSPVSVSLDGTRLRLPGKLTGTEDGWTASIPLLASRWQGPLLPAPSGDYTVRLMDAAGATLPVRIEPLGPELVPGLLEVAVDSAVVTIAPPLTEAERGPANQARLEAEYRSASFEPENAIFFESFYGQNASCNPRALDSAVAELLPDVKRYWSVVDASVELPPGAVRIVEGSEQWWRARGTARLLVINDWLRKRYRKRSYQKVLQTWHGTPLKKIALSRPGLRLRPSLATLRERSKWDFLLAQNPYTARTMRSAYAWFGPTWQEGYPRDDQLSGGDPAPVRERLGIPHDVTVLLYAPTWRDDRPGHIDHLDVAEFADKLGPGYLTLIRGHSRTLKPGEDVHAAHVLDVTGYPDVTDLFLVADALITDYSSVMFDYSVTGKPLFFFAPDLELYRRQLRGFYFDLDEAAPGPLVQDPDELVQLVRDRDAVTERFAGKYAAWRDRFNPRDDGGAARRVVERLIREKVLI